MFIVICLYLAWVGLNTLFSSVIIRGISHPKYSLMIDSNEFSLYSSLIMFVGFPILLFRKQLRRRRIKEYYEYVLKNNEFIRFGKIPDVMFDVRITKEEMEKLGRSIKLEEIKRKTKKKW